MATPDSHASSSLDESKYGNRYNIYGVVHKGLRRGHTQFMNALGKADFDKDQSKLIAELKDFIEIMKAHLFHEETFVHPAIQERNKTIIPRINDDHDSHRRRFAAVEKRIKAVEDGGKAFAGQALYLEYTRLVAEDLEHMIEEETTVNEVLWDNFTDAELLAIEGKVVASLTPKMNADVGILMIPAATTPERIELLKGMKAAVPPFVYAGIFDGLVKTTLNAEELAEVVAAGLAPA